MSAPALSRNGRGSPAPHFARLSVRDIGLKLTNQAEAGDAEWAEGEEAKAALYRAANEYLARFAKTERGSGSFAAGGNRCVCGSWLGGILGTFDWGITHGEGRCAACGHPCRAYHRVVAEGWGELDLPLGALPYHPDDVVKP